MAAMRLKALRQQLNVVHPSHPFVPPYYRIDPRTIANVTPRQRNPAAGKKIAVPTGAGEPAAAVHPGSA
jgi:hypothetical protein